MSTLKSIFECKICHGPLSECVILPCGETICRKHSHSIQDLYCPSCKKTHQVPKDGFPLNKLVNLLFETDIQNLDMGGKFRAAEESCSKLENSIEMFNNLKSCIQSFSPGFCKLASVNRYHNYSQKEHKLLVHVKILSLYNRNFSILDFKTPKKKHKKRRKSFGQNLNQVTGPDFDLDYQPE
ncbi:hypothetical protein BpHYR1_000728 [Brachionus plicatilis]|uniref:Uncharacterized protein n=1 Tax=Brachionus plicatilis TaxID=10195 RepID=A0A3M7S3F8_BRAPC|nr:hypothetical protein BpHYR1_000728 [Brachionus plicatilis]